ncbi:1346_t:CDS:1, partial [Paraglomus brasilianum]
KLFKKCAILSIEELLQKCKKGFRQFSAFMVFRCILRPNFTLKYGEASIFYGKLWSKATPTLKTEMTRLSGIVTSKLKENIVFKHYNQDGKISTDDSMADSIIDANGLNTDEVSSTSTDFEFSNDANTYAGHNGDIGNEYIDTYLVDYTNTFDHMNPFSCENAVYINMPNIADVGAYNFHNDETLGYNDYTIVGNVAADHYVDAIYVGVCNNDYGINGNFAYDNAFTQYSGGDGGIYSIETNYEQTNVDHQ